MCGTTTSAETLPLFTCHPAHSMAVKGQSEPGDTFLLFFRSGFGSGHSPNSDAITRYANTKSVPVLSSSSSITVARAGLGLVAGNQTGLIAHGSSCKTYSFSASRTSDKTTISSLGCATGTAESASWSMAVCLACLRFSKSR